MDADQLRHAVKVARHSGITANEAHMHWDLAGGLTAGQVAAHWVVLAIELAEQDRQVGPGKELYLTSAHTGIYRR